MINSPSIRVTDIGEFIRHNSCDRRFKLGLHNSQLAREVPFFQRLLNPLDPVLQEEGHKREDEWATELTRLGYKHGTANPNNQANTTTNAQGNSGKRLPWDELVNQLRGIAPGEKFFWREVEVKAEIGAFDIIGHIDFVVLLWPEGLPRLRVVECKSSRRDRTYHRIQLVMYKMLIECMIASQPPSCCGHSLTANDLEYVVARIDEATNQNFSILELNPLTLDMERADVERLLAEDGLLDQIVHSRLDQLSYQIDQKCDGCTFNVHCLPESARYRRLELLSLPSSTIRVLRSSGINTIDDLADIELDGNQAEVIRNSLGFNENLQHLQLDAAARRTTLPGVVDRETYPVQSLPNTGNGHLPFHEIGGARIVRVYLSVDYDYAENRIGALSAHVTTSDHEVYTGFIKHGETRVPNPEVLERLDSGNVDSEGRKVYSYRVIHGVDVIKFVSSPWSGDYATDSGTEKEIVQSFFHELVDAIASVAEASHAPIHFYVWSRAEMTRLVEACSRVSSRLLSHLRELLGCRENLEQLIFSSLGDEVSRRFGLGWTGRGLSVVSSLQWFGRIYHWTRVVNGKVVELDRAFTQDLFDFKTRLDFMPNGGRWVQPNTLGAVAHRFEIRSRFNDSLPAPYWRAFGMRFQIQMIRI